MVLARLSVVVGMRGVDFRKRKIQCAEISAFKVTRKVGGEVTVSLRDCLTSVQEVTTDTSPRLLCRLDDQKIAKKSLTHTGKGEDLKNPSF
jgi:hypothetical protein